MHRLYVSVFYLVPTMGGLLEPLDRNHVLGDFEGLPLGLDGELSGNTDTLVKA